jgi:hypothetical protein
MDYYITITEPNGNIDGPTRLLGVHDKSSAIKQLQQHHRKNPNCKITIQAVCQVEDIGKTVDTMFVEAKIKAARRPRTAKNQLE